MPQLKFKCASCLKDFTIKYIFSKPAKITCPYCSSPKVQEDKEPGCGCGGSGSRFT